jgi:hypothetical protein
VTHLKQVRARAAAASDGPRQRHGSDVLMEGSSTPGSPAETGAAEVCRQADAESVAHARQDITTCWPYSTDVPAGKSQRRSQARNWFPDAYGVGLLGSV